MTRLPGLDPEVLADLRFRDDSERDRTRSSLVCCDDCKHHVRDHDCSVGPCRKCECQEFVRGGGPSWSPPAIVEHWPCRGGCNAMVGVTREAVDARNAGNAMLARRREKPIGRHEVVWCDDCNSRRRMT